MSPRACVIALALALAGSVGCSALGPSTGNGPPASIVLAPGGTFVDDRGATVALSQFRGGPVVVSAIFTSCTVRCPMTVSKLRDVAAAYAKGGREVPIVVMTLDPKADTVARLRRFKESRSLPDSWHFIRGSLEDTRALARWLEVHAAWDDAHVDHDVKIAVFDASGRLARGFSGWSFDADAAVVE